MDTVRIAQKGRLSRDRLAKWKIAPVFRSRRYASAINADTQTPPSAHPAQRSGPLTAATGASAGSATDQSPSDQHAAGRLPTCVDMSVASKQVAVVGGGTA